MTSDFEERVAATMAEIAARGEFGLFVQWEGEPVWQAALDLDNPPLMIEIDADRQVITLNAELGAASVADTGPLDRLALDYSGLHHSTGGLRVARQREDGVYLLLADLAAAAATPENFARLARGFGETARAWREIVAAGGPKGPADLGALSVNELIFRV